MQQVGVHVGVVEGAERKRKGEEEERERGGKMRK